MAVTYHHHPNEIQGCDKEILVSCLLTAEGEGNKVLLWTEELGTSCLQRD